MICQEAATNFRLSRWQRFGTLEVPSSMHSLIWNSMMSFGGGWFFVAQSEAITVLNKNIKLPGLGSYMATAVEKGDNTAAVWAIIAMLAVITRFGPARLAAASWHGLTSLRWNWLSLDRRLSPGSTASFAVLISSRLD